jgi:multicomponent Na+:H+ antiporter subunit A
MKLWPGLVLALGVSAGVIVAGFLLWWARSPLAAVQTRLAVGPSASRVFEELVELLLRMAKATARWSQSGSLPAYLAIILVTLVALPALPVVMASAWPSEIDVAELPSQLAVVVLLVTAAVALAFVRRRFAGAMLLGAVGYSMSILFVIQGAPDLALTQVLVETISVVAFLLVMRRLPADFPAEPFRLVKAGRGAVAVAVGVGFAAFLVTALAGQVSEGPRAEMIEQAAPQAKGENVVNVILTDVRALDTLGEITVLVVAAVGIAALAGPRRRLGPVPTLRPSPVQLAVLRLITPLLGLAAAVLFFVGHDLPGGGFIAGLLVGTIPVLRWLSAREPAASWIQPHRLLGAGLLVAMAAGLLGWIVGGAFLQGLTHQVSFGPISYKLTSASLFDLGVLLVVVGLVLAVLEYLGRDAAVDLAPGGGPAHPDVAVGGSRALPVAVPGEGA